MNTVVNTPQAQGYTPRQQKAAFNTAMAEAHQQADNRYNAKPLDRAGASRGAGQDYMASIASAQGLAEGIARAYGQQQSDQLANANINLGNQQNTEGAGLGYTGISQQQAYADALASLQRQQNMAASSPLGGLLGGGLTNFLGY